MSGKNSRRGLRALQRERFFFSRRALTYSRFPSALRTPAFLIASRHSSAVCMARLTVGPGKQRIFVAGLRMITRSLDPRTAQ